jgi:hypothetical protein
MRKLLKQLIDMIIMFLSQLSNTKDSYNPSNTVVITETETPKVTKIRRAADKYRYEHDKLYAAVKYSMALYGKSAAILHFSWNKHLYKKHPGGRETGLTPYFHKLIEKNRYANSHFGVGKTGECHRYLPDFRNPGWTQWIPKKDAGILNSQGKIVRGVSGQAANNIGISFEIVNINFESYTEKQYEAVAIRLRWMLRVCKKFRLWFVFGHEQISPFLKNDPGKKWDWEKLLIEYCGVRKNFYNNYLSYLAETSAYDTHGDEGRSHMKWLEVKQGYEKIGKDLIDKPKDFCL